MEALPPRENPQRMLRLSAPIRGREQSKATPCDERTQKMKNRTAIYPAIQWQVGAILALCFLASGAVQAVPISHTRTLHNVDYVVAGIAGVGGGTGTITISGINGPVTRAFLYWHGINNGAGAVYNNPTVTINGNPVTGVSLGDAPTNCWEQGSSRAFEADVTTVVAGNGAYVIAGLSNGAGYNANGASLVVVFDDGSANNDRDLVFFVGNDSNKPEGFPGENEGWHAVLTPISYRGGSVKAIFHVADGQNFPDSSITFTTGGTSLVVSDSTILWDGASVTSAGTSRATNGGLWDIHTFNITAAFGPPGPTTLQLDGQDFVNDCIGVVLMLLDLEPGSGPTPNPCGTSLSENFDGVTAPTLPAGWMATNASGNSTRWVTSLTAPDTFPNNAFIPDQAGISDKYLDTPGISIASSSAQVSFRNYFQTEFSNGTYWDGGVLEVSSPNINGGAFTDILAAGGNFVTGGYTGVISNAEGNPLSGRMAWSGNSGGYINTVVNLPNVSGQTITLRFRMGTDESVAAPGWRVDTILVRGGICPSTTLVNISTRLRVETGDNVLIGGFIVVTGTQPKKVIVRAIGPSLPLPGGLPDPVLELRNSAGTLIAMNDDWRSDQEAEIIATGIPPNNSLESAIVATLPANNSAYTAIVRDHNSATGVGLVEAYDLDNTVNSKLGNISTRGFVGTGDTVMIGGFIVGGEISTRVIVRAIGPSLPLAGKLADPTLALHDGNGALIVSNDNWRTGGQEAEIIATGIPPSNDLESAIVRTLAPGNYTAIVRGVNDTTGVALVEVYDLGPP
jgi:hypothetical protein